jgi:hypothetical protein
MQASIRRHRPFSAIDRIIRIIMVASPHYSHLIVLKLPWMPGPIISPADLDMILKGLDHIHARTGHAEGPQVDDPHAPVNDVVKALLPGGIK